MKEISRRITGMIVTGENQNDRRKTWLGANLSSINPTKTSFGSNPGSRGDRPVTVKATPSPERRRSSYVSFASDYIYRVSVIRACS
jgi:hypothetical protein